VEWEVELALARGGLAGYQAPCPSTGRPVLEAFGRWQEWEMLSLKSRCACGNEKKPVYWNGLESIFQGRIEETSEIMPQSK
jgi:hypothetical protein